MADTIDFDARYKVESWPGIAFYVDSFADDDGWVYAVMVGDDRKHLVEIDDLTKLDDDGYCGGCGQIGCGWG